MEWMTKDEAIAKGMYFTCTICPLVYDRIPHSPNEFKISHKDIPRCSCGCDQLVDLRDAECADSTLRFLPGRTPGV